MSVRKRKGSAFYLYDFTIQGLRFRGSTETDDAGLAKAKEAELRRDAWLQTKMGVKPSMTLNEACARYWQDYAQYLKTGESCRKHQIRHVLRIIGKHIAFEQIGDSTLARFVATRRAESVNSNNKSKRRISNASVNREVDLLGSLHRKVKQWGYEINRDVDFSNHKLPEPKHRTRWLTPDEVERAINATGKKYQRQMILFSLYTGARKGNTLAIDKSRIDLENRLITFVDVKSVRPGGEMHTVPIVDGLLEMLVDEMELKPGDKGPLFCHTKGKHAGEPYKDFRRGFQAACARAGITDIRVHDLRHTCASWLVQRGVPIQVVKDILGHKNIATTMKYAHQADDARSRAMEFITAQIRHSGAKGKANTQKDPKKIKVS